MGKDLLTGRKCYLKETHPTHDAAERAKDRLIAQVEAERIPDRAATVAYLLPVGRIGQIRRRSGLCGGRRAAEHGAMARYHVTVVSGDSARTAAETAASVGAEVIRKMSVPEGIAALATDEQIDALVAAGATVHRHADLAEGRGERLAEVGEGDRYAEALRRLAGR